MKNEKYEEKLTQLQHQLLMLQHAYGRQSRQAIIALEGWDAAGKGGLIRRMGWVMDPRPLKVWQTAAPTAREKRQHWLQRFWEKVPRHGEIGVFDRTWYGRVLVERIEGFADEDEWQRAYDEINNFERTLSAEGIRIVKLFLDIDRDTQLQRFIDRFNDPQKRWKITEEDIRNRARWDEYQSAYADMLDRTSTQWAGWTRIDANDKKEARIDALTTIVEQLGADVDVTPPDVPTLVRAFFEDRD